MNLAAWAERNGVARVSACRWFRAGLLPVAARGVGRLIVGDEPIGEAGPRALSAVYARVSSADQRADLDRQVARVTAWATAQQIPVDKVVGEVGPALSRHRSSEILTSMCARLYGMRAAGSRTERALAAVAATEQRGAA